MHVISGKAKGRKLKVPKLSRGRRIRPLTDQAREALFNILMDRVFDSSFLDLFAGSGAVGIEALSRGARLSIFVELDKVVVQAIRENLQSTGFSDSAEVYSLDALRAVKVLDSKGAKFDIIFIGAPYDSPALEKVLELISQASLLKPSGVVVAEHRTKHKIAPGFGGLMNVRDYRYGDTMLSLYQVAEGAPQK